MRKSGQPDLPVEELIGKRAAFNSTYQMPEQVNRYFYQAYGVKIESAIPLPELTETDPPADVRIGYGEIPNSLVNSIFDGGEVFAGPGRTVRATAEAMLIEWQGVGKVLIRGGREIVVEPEASVSDADLQPFLIGPVLSVLLQQRGFFVLHASAVEINGAALAFLGAKGDGKSTLAAHLQVRGHRLLSDDIVPVAHENDRLTVFPGFPRINLFGDSIAAVGEQPANFPRIHRFVEKRSFRPRENFSPEPLPLGCLYILSENEEVGLEKPGLAAAFMDITRHTYLNRYLKAFGSEREHFRQCQALIQKIPVLKLNRPHNFAVMNRVCRLLEDHVRELAAAKQFEEQAQFRL